MNTHISRINRNDAPFKVGDEVKPKTVPINCLAHTCKGSETITEIRTFKIESIWFNEETNQFLINLYRVNWGWRASDFEKIEKMVMTSLTPTMLISANA